MWRSPTARFAEITRPAARPWVAEFLPLDRFHFRSAASAGTTPRVKARAEAAFERIAMYHWRAARLAVTTRRVMARREAACGPTKISRSPTARLVGTIPKEITAGAPAV